MTSLSAQLNAAAVRIQNSEELVAFIETFHHNRINPGAKNFRIQDVQLKVEAKTSSLYGSEYYTKPGFSAEVRYFCSKADARERDDSHVIGISKEEIEQLFGDDLLTDIEVEEVDDQQSEQ